MMDGRKRMSRQIRRVMVGFSKAIDRFVERIIILILQDYKLIGGRVGNRFLRKQSRKTD